MKGTSGDTGAGNAGMWQGEDGGKLLKPTGAVGLATTGTNLGMGRKVGQNCGFILDPLSEFLCGKPDYRQLKMKGQTYNRYKRIVIVFMWLQA